MEDHPASPIYEWTFRRVAWATLVFVFIALSFYLLYRFYQVVFILFVAIVLGTVMRPAVTWLYRKGIPRIGGGHPDLYPAACPAHRLRIIVVPPGI